MFAPPKSRPARPHFSILASDDVLPVPDFPVSAPAVSSSSLPHDGNGPVLDSQTHSAILRQQTRANLRFSTADGATFGIMVGVGETYIAAFALAIGLGEVSAGLVSSVPLLAGGVLQLISLRAMKWVGSEKRWIVLCAGLQSLAFLPLIYAAITGSISLPALLLITSLYWAGGLASGPAWNTWIEAIVPSKVRPRYFAKRTRISQLTTLIGLVGGGALLQYASATNHVMLGFTCLFITAGIFRLWSTYWLSRHVTPSALTSLPKPASMDKSAVTAERSQFSVSGIQLLAYLVVVQGMVQISGPFFASYMLEELHYSYAGYVGMLSIGFLAKVAALTWWVTVAQRGGAKMLLWIGGVGIIPLSSLWIVSQSYIWLSAVQILSGTLWAAYELGFFLMFFEALPVEKRIRLLTYYNLANTAAWCGGALIGAWILKSYDTSVIGYHMLFGISSLGRLAALGLLFGVHLRSVPVIKLGIRILGIRPNATTVDTPILNTLDDPMAMVGEATGPKTAAA